MDFSEHVSQVTQLLLIQKRTIRTMNGAGFHEQYLFLFIYHLKKTPTLSHLHFMSNSTYQNNLKINLLYMNELFIFYKYLPYYCSI